MKPILALLSFSALASALPTQDLTPKAPPQERPVVLRNAVLHTVSGGVILNGSLWFENGVIRGVHPKENAPQPPDGAEIIDLQGAHVYPGLIAAQSSIGLQEIGQVRQSVDVREVSAVAPEVYAAVAVNPDSTVIPVTRSNGVLTAGVFPSGGLIPGRVSVLNLDGWTWEDMAVSQFAGLVVDWPAERSGRRRFFRPRPDGDPGARVAQQRREIDDAFTEARAWMRAAERDPEIATDIRWQAMVPALRGEVPVFLLADEVEEIETAVSWAVRAEVRPVVVGGRDALLCLDLLKRHDVPIVVAGVHELPRRRDSHFAEPFELPGKLHAAGIRWCLASGGSYSNERNLPYHAATAVAYGLPRDAAIAAISLYAAEILGVSDRLGSLDVGKDATLIVTDGSPLELTTEVKHAFVRGRRVDLRNKQTELAKKYREKYRQLGLTK